MVETCGIVKNLTHTRDAGNVSWSIDSFSCPFHLTKWCMNIFRRILVGALAAMLLVQPALALGSCCCTTVTDDATSEIRDGVPAAGAACPNCRSAESAGTDRRDTTGTVHSEGCECAQQRQLQQADRPGRRDASLESVTDVLWDDPVRVPQIDNVRATASIGANPLSPRISLQVLLCRWLT